jgi:RNA polymerase sigma-70 factor (ECF subfamily)
MKEFDELYSLYSRSIYKYLFYLTGEHHLSEDLLQETFFNAFKAIDKFQGKSKVSTWLYTIAKNVYLKEINKNKKTDVVFSEEIMLKQIDLDMPEAIVESKDNVKAIISAIRRLEENYRQVILLRSIGELSFRDIGELLNRNENWARITFYRAKLKLKQEMEVNQLCISKNSIKNTGGER